MIDAAREALKKGQKDIAREQLEQALENDEHNAEAWFLMSQAVDTEEDQRICLENVLQLDPDHPGATAALKLLDGGEATASLFGDFDPFAEADEAPAFAEDAYFGDAGAEPGAGGRQRGGGFAGNRRLLLAMMVFFAVGTVVMVVLAILLATGAI